MKALKLDFVEARRQGFRLTLQSRPTMSVRQRCTASTVLYTKSVASGCDERLRMRERKGEGSDRVSVLISHPAKQAVRHPWRKNQVKSNDERMVTRQFDAFTGSWFSLHSALLAK